MSYLKDAWSYTHLFGSCVLALSIFHFIHNELAFIIALGLGILWEVADEINKRLEFNWWFLDNSGFDIRDLGMDLTGILLAMWLIL